MIYLGSILSLYARYMRDEDSTSTAITTATPTTTSTSTSTVAKEGA
jgi:hypothetical protein